MNAHVWLVVPTYNEAENIEALAAAALGELPEGSRLLVVDDSSPDGTGRIADRLAAENPAIAVLHRARKEGIGPAYVAGFRTALAGGADLVVQLDADFSHDPADLPRLLAAAEKGGGDGGDDGDGGDGGEGADLVLGSRYVADGGVEHWGAVRRAISRGGSAYARGLLGVPVRDLTGGFKVFRRRVLEAIDLESISSAGYAFQVETTYRAIRAGFRVVELPIRFVDRRVGASKMSGRIVLEAALRVPQMRLRPPR